MITVDPSCVPEESARALLFTLTPQRKFPLGYGFGITILVCFDSLCSQASVFFGALLSTLLSSNVLSWALILKFRYLLVTLVLLCKGRYECWTPLFGCLGALYYDNSKFVKSPVEKK